MSAGDPRHEPRRRPGYVAQPEPLQPETGKPETSKPEPLQPETGKPETRKPEPLQPETGQPETRKPEPLQPETGEPETRKPEPLQPETGKPETCKPEPLQPETGQPETRKPEPLQPETGQPETCEREPIEMEVEPSPEPCCSQSLCVQPPTSCAPEDRYAQCSQVSQSNIFKKGLWKRRRNKGESLHALYFDIMNLASLAWPEGPSCEDITVEAFINALDEPVRSEVYASQPETLGDALQIAVQIENKDKEPWNWEKLSDQDKADIGLGLELVRRRNFEIEHGIFPTDAVAAHVAATAEPGHRPYLKPSDCYEVATDPAQEAVRVECMENYTARAEAQAAEYATAHPGEVEAFQRELREKLKAADQYDVRAQDHGCMPETEMFQMHMADPRVTIEMRKPSCGYVMCTVENVRKSYFKRGAASLRKKGRERPLDTR